MTIAMCYLLHEGVVFGADSTSSTQSGGFHYFNHNQKLFEVGEGGTLGVITWGLGSLSDCSHRTLIADLSDKLKVKPAKSVTEAMDRWIDIFWAAYNVDPTIVTYRAIAAKTPYSALVVSPLPSARNKQEEELYQALTDVLVVGFCLGGRAGGSRAPQALEVLFDPLATSKPAAAAIPLGKYRFWGVPNMAERLIKGGDSIIKDAIVASPLWRGSLADLEAVLAPHELSHPNLPIRDAVDFVHMCIHSTIKALKFSAYSQICGGPIEISAITTDRPYRWVRHKVWDAAVLEGEP